MSRTPSIATKVSDGNLLLGTGTSGGQTIRSRHPGGHPGSAEKLAGGTSDISSTESTSSKTMSLPQDSPGGKPPQSSVSTVRGSTSSPPAETKTPPSVSSTLAKVPHQSQPSTSGSSSQDKLGGIGGWAEKKTSTKGGESSRGSYNNSSDSCGGDGSSASLRRRNPRTGKDPESPKSDSSIDLE